MTSFPASPLDLRAELQLTAGTWTDISSDVYQREGTSAPVTLQRGRPDESSQATASQATFELDNRSGDYSPLNAASPYFGAIGRNTPARFSVPSQSNYLRLENDSVSYASCPASSSIEISGNIDMRAEIEPSTYMPFTLAVRYDGGTWSWVWLVLGDGTQQWWWCDSGGSSHTVRSTMPLPLGHTALRVTLATSTGTVTFYSAATISGTWAQLGSAQVAGSTSIRGGTSPIQLGYSASYAEAGYDYQGLNGKVYKFQLLNGIGGTTVASPDFTAQTAGAASFTDAQGNTWTLNGTAEISDRDYRYHGEMSALPPKWDVTGSDMSVPATAGGILRRLGQGSAPELSPIKRALLAQSGDLAVVQYWPCEDLQGSTSIGSATGGPLMMVTGGTGDGSVTTTGPAFAASTSFLCSSALPTLNSSSWYGQVPRYTSNGSIVVRFLMDLGSTIPSGNRDLVRLITTGTCQEVSMRVYSSTELGMYGNTASGSNEFDTTAITFGSDVPSGSLSGTPLWVSMELQPSGSSVDYSLVILYPGATTAYEGSGSFSGSVGNVTAVYVDPPGVFTDTVIGHVSVQSAWESLFDLQEPLNAWQGETAAARFSRICGENGITARIIGPPDVSVAMGAQPVDTLLDILQECEDADRGQIYEPRQVLGLGYRTLGSLLSQAAAVSVDYSQAQPGGVSGGGETGLEPTYDDQYSRNDITAQRGSGNVSGASYQYQLDDGSRMSISSPPTGIGDYSDSITLNVQSDSQLPDEAGWMVHIGTVDEARWPGIPFNLARSAITESLFYELLSADIGDYAALANLPDLVVYDPVRQLAWQVKESLGGFHYALEWCCVPESPYEVALLDNQVYGRADTDGSSLASSASAGTAPSEWGGDNGWTNWGGTNAAVTTSGGDLVITSSGSGTFWQAYGPGVSCSATQKIAVVATVTSAQALGSVSVGIHLSGGSDTYTASTGVAVTAGETVTMCITATAAAGQDQWQAYVIDNESVGAGDVMTVSLAYGAVSGTLSVATGSGDPLWTTTASDCPFDVAVSGERITVAGVSGASSPQTFTVIRAVNGVTKSQSSGADLRLWFPPILSMV